MQRTIQRIDPINATRPGIGLLPPALSPNERTEVRIEHTGLPQSNTACR